MGVREFDDHFPDLLPTVTPGEGDRVHDRRAQVCPPGRSEKVMNCLADRDLFAVGVCDEAVEVEAAAQQAHVEEGAS